MVELRPLIVVTGTVRVEGGETNTVQKSSSNRAGTNLTVVMAREISKDRRAANVITTDYMRRLRQLGLLRTPFGMLFSSKQIADVKQLQLDTGKKIAAYNGVKGRVCHLSNCMLWEPLQGSRAAAVAAWIDEHQKDADVRAVLQDLVKTEMKAA